MTKFLFTLLLLAPGIIMAQSKMSEWLQAKKDLESASSELRKVLYSDAYDSAKSELDSRTPSEQVRKTSCTQQNIADGESLSACRLAVMKYAQANAEIQRLQKDKEKPKRPDDDSDSESDAPKQRMQNRQMTEGRVCLECIGAGGQQQGGFGRNQGGDSFGSTLTNSLMALMAMSSSNQNSFGGMAGNNMNMGFPTPIASSSSFMSASPYTSSVLQRLQQMNSYGASMGGYGGLPYLSNMSMMGR